MDLLEIFIAVIIPSGVMAALTSGVLTYCSNKKLDIYQRTMEIRKDLYTKIINQTAFFFDTVTKEDADNAREDLLKYFREIQIWGSDEVVRSFKKVLDLMIKNDDLQETQNNRNLRYKDFIIAMRRDILGETNLDSEEIDIRGIRKN